MAASDSADWCCVTLDSATRALLSVPLPMLPAAIEVIPLPLPDIFAKTPSAALKSA